MPNTILENPDINTHKVVARKDKNICTGDEKLVNRALSKAERKTKSEKTKKRTRTTLYSSDGSVEDIC